jgi:dTDP-4-amino-4,6-dideoxygalactose transaminase
MPVDLAGYPCDYSVLNDLVQSEPLRKLFKANTPEQEQLGRIMILSDAAHSMGAFFKGKRAGALTDVTVFSFHAVKNLTTSEGGAIALNLPAPFDNLAIYQALCIKSLHGQNKDALAKTQKGNWRYDIVEAGYKCNMTDISAAIGLVELERYDSDILVRRKQIFDAYSNFFSGFEWAQVPVYTSADKTSSYHVYQLRINAINEAKRDQIIAAIFDKDISVNVHFIPVPMMTFYRAMGYDVANYPVTFDNYSREITLPVFYDLTDEQVTMVCEAVRESVLANL